VALLPWLLLRMGSTSQRYGGGSPSFPFYCIFFLILFILFYIFFFFRFIFKGSLDRLIRIWDLASGTFLAKLEGHTDSVYSVSFSPDGKRKKFRVFFFFSFSDFSPLQASFWPPALWTRRSKCGKLIRRSPQRASWQSPVPATRTLSCQWSFRPTANGSSQAPRTGRCNSGTPPPVPPSACSRDTRTR